MISIKRYKLTDNRQLELPQGSRILNIRFNSIGEICISVEFAPNPEQAIYHFNTYYDGKEIEPGWTYCGTHNDTHFYMKIETKDRYINTLIDDAINDTVQDLLYHNRQNDEYLHEGDIEEAIHDGRLTLDDIVNRFRFYLEKEFDIH